MVNDDIKVEDLVEDLIWAREMLRIFSRLERLLKNELGSYGVEKIVMRNPVFLGLFFLSILIGLLGVILWLQENNIYFLSICALPFFAIGYIYSNIRKEKNKNIFRFIGKCVIPQEHLLGTIEEYIFQNKEHFEEIISWRVNTLEDSEKEKFSHMFNDSTWESVETAQQQAIILAILMVSLQKFLHTHREVYNEYVKKLPLMNAGYNYKPTKKKKALAETDIQTFGFPSETKAS